MGLPVLIAVAALGVVLCLISFGGRGVSARPPSADYPFQGEIRRSDGTPYTETVVLMLLQLDPFPSTVSYTPVVAPGGQFDAALPEGFYWVGTEDNLRPLHMPRMWIDLRSEMTDVVITLLDDPEPIVGQAPPNASLITVSAPDIEGYATVTGAPGAVPPHSAVAVANLSGSTVAATLADASGAFTTTALYAPPGSALLIKCDLDSARVVRFWELAQVASTETLVSDMNMLPGTILTAGGNPPRNGSVQTFSSVGSIWETVPRQWAGWWISGTLETPTYDPGYGLKVAPGETMTLTADLRVTSPGLGCTEPLTAYAVGTVALNRSFGTDGRAAPWGMDYNAYLFTPTGLPIDGGGPAPSTDVAAVVLDTWTCASDSAFDAAIAVTFTVPSTLPEGTYLPEVLIPTADVPLTTTPIIPCWFDISHNRSLPPVTIGDPAPPHIPWALLADVPTNGHRGVQARNDRGYYQLYSWILFPPEDVVIPRLNARTGETLAYRLEPGTNWLSASDRRLPNPPRIPFDLPSGHLMVEVLKPDGSVDILGPATVRQSSQQSPGTPGGVDLIGQRSGRLDDVYHLSTMSDTFAYSFDQYGPHEILVVGEVDDIYGNTYLINSTYDVNVARVLDLDPGQLPTMPYVQGDTFARGLHLYPPFPADVTVRLVQMPFSDPSQAITSTVSGQANRFGYFQPPQGTAIDLVAPGEFRVDITAVYTEPDGTLWMGTMRWGNVIEGPAPMMRAHGRRGLDYNSPVIDQQSAWFEVDNIPPERKQGAVEVYYPYHTGDVHWGYEGREPGDSIHPIITIEDLGATGLFTGPVYDVLKANYPRGTSEFRRPPSDARSYTNLISRTMIAEAPLFFTTRTGESAASAPEEIDQWGYWYGTSERPGVRVREHVSEDMLGVGYWGFDDTYNYQIGVPTVGDLPGDLKWEYGGAVLRTITETSPLSDPVALTEYAIYSSLWVLLPDDDDTGARVTAPFRGANGATIDGGPIMTVTVQGQPTAIDVLFLPLSVRPGDVLEVGDVIGFSGQVGPPLSSQVSVTITAPSGSGTYTNVLRANKIGWVYDPGFDFPADVPGRWTVDVHVLHDEPLLYASAPLSYNEGTVLGTTGRYEFYVVEPGSPRLFVTSPQPGFVTWPQAEIEPIHIRGAAPPGATAVHYTIYDKGTVMRQGSVTPSAGGTFAVTYDAEALNADFPYVSLTAREGQWEGLADEVTIGLLAVGGAEPRGNVVTLLGEEVFVPGAPAHWVYLPLALRGY
jgi:hypothetical protein